MSDTQIGLECPNPYCDNSGGYPDYDNYGEVHECQCDFCWTEPYSIFNLTRDNQPPEEDPLVYENQKQSDVISTIWDNETEDEAWNEL
jgi:hypothetical protein